MGETMNSRTRVLAAALLAGALMVGFAAPAQASPSTYTPPPQPTDGQYYVYGLPQAQFPTASPTGPSTIGGWLNSDWHRVSLGGSGTLASGWIYRPVSFEVWEPYIDASTGELRIPYRYMAPQDNQNGGANLNGSSFILGNTVVQSVTPRIYCQQTEWAVVGAPTNTNFATVGGVNTTSVGASNGAAVASTVSRFSVMTSTNVAKCPYIREIDISVQYYTGASGTSGGTSQSYILPWLARNAYVDHRAYVPYDPNQAICALSASSVSNPISPVCTDIYGAAGRVDGEDFNQVCANPPATWVWGDFSWLPTFLGFYAKCMFNPVNGWDRDHQVSTAWTNGPPGQLISPITTMVSALQFPNSCGVIVPGTPGVLGGVFSVNTCSWTWAGQLHDALALILPAWFGWWALWFVVSAISGVINRKVPSPAQLGRGSDE